MTSNEIRDRINDATAVYKTYNAAKSPVNFELAKMQLLGEVAAQLAELVEHFKRVDESVFGAPNATKKEKTST